MKRRFLSVILMLAIILAMLPTTAMAVASGTCGDNLTWTLDDAGTLTISGTGPMTNYASSPDLPWNDNRDAIKNIVIENGVTSIETWAFSNITGLTGITIPDSVTSIGVNAFWGCTNLANVTIGSGVVSIGAGAFIDCSSLAGITIPDSVISIGEGAFLRCTDLASVNIGSGVTTIESNAFSGCTALTGVTIPDNVTDIGNRLFEGCTNLANITISNNVASIKDGTFSDCTALTSITIPDSVTSIEAHAFSGCTSLTSVTIPGGVTAIGDHMFNGCTSLTDIQVDASNAYYAAVDGVLFNKDKTTLITYPIGKSGNYTVPDTVTSIGTNAFFDCTGLTGITIPDSVASIGDQAFWDCTNLTSLTIPSGITDIKAATFYNCANLSDVYYWGTETDWTQISIDTNNDPLTAATRWYPGSAAITTSTPETGAANPVVTVTSDRPFAIIHAAARSTTMNNVTVDEGTTGLVLSSVSLDPSDTSNKTMLLGFTGSSEGGNISVTIGSAAFKGPENFTNSNVINIDMPAVSGGPVDPGPVDPATGSLTITNSVSGIDAADKTFPFTVTGPDGYSNTVTITGSGSITLDGLAPGEYTVTEDTDAATIDGYDLVADVRNTPVTVVAGETVTVTATNTYSVSSGHTPDPAPVDPDPTPVRPKPVTPGKPTDEPPALIPSPIQADAVRKDRKEIPDWIDRLELPEYAQTFYNVMAGNTLDSPTAGGRKRSIFENEQIFVLKSTDEGGPVIDVKYIETVEFDMTDMYGGETGKIKSAIFEDESFYRVTVETGDKVVDYTKLELGSVVRTSTFNGIYVTKIPYDDSFDAKKKEACEYIAAVFHAFDRDHPEIFWLSGKCKARIMVVTDPGTKAKEAYFFLSTADKDGFDMRAPTWTGTGAIDAGIARRDAAVSEILGTVTAGDTAGKIRQLNKWLTEHNQYNTTPDLTTIGNEPHECLAALLGQIGTDGPVCDGYSRAFKVLCDRLSIPCVLETGWAKATASGTPGFHMWNLAQVGGIWYGCDITWDDPSVKGVVAAKSGRENENFLLVGTDTAMNGLTFAQSHVVQNQAVAGGVDFNNGPAMSPIAYSGISATVFDDVPADAWYYDGVYWAVDRGITVGTSAATFSPDQDCTEIQILTLLWRSAGKPAVNAAPPFSVTGAADYADAAKWAYSKGMISADFRQDAPCTRAAAVKFMWQAEGSPAAQASDFTDVPAGSDYAQAVAWAVNRGITTGTTATTFSPDQVCTRAQIVTLLCRDRA